MSDNKKIAIIGAGPAGYTLAQELVKDNFHVELFDKEAEIGGAIYTGIPDYRMPKAFLKKAYDGLIAAGAVFHFNTFINPEKFKELRNNFDAVVVATGAQIENTFGFETGKGVYAGLTLLYDLNIHHNQEAYKKYHKAVVWGGGNVAMDCCRSLVRILDDVTVIYRRSEKEMPASAFEIKQAKQEGVKFEFLTNIKDIERDENGYVKGVKAVRMELGAPDASGRASTHEIAGSEFDHPTDLVVMAIGQKVDLSALDPNLKITDNHHTNEENVFIMGDAFTGPKTIGNAVVEGKNTAKLIKESLA